MTDSRTNEIRLGQAVNLAAQYHSLQGHGSIDEWLDSVRADVPRIKAFVDELQASAGVQAAFPGSTVEPPQAAPVGGYAPSGPHPAEQPQQYQQQAPAPAPAPVPGAASKLGDWQYLIDDIDAGKFDRWFDNRVGKRNPNGPDFKSKNSHPIVPDKALWLKGKYPLDPAVVEALNARGIAA